MLRLGNSKLLSVGQAAALALKSPRCAANALHDKLFGFGKVPFPRNVFLHLVNRCDMACPMCNIGQAREDRQSEFLGDMPFEIAEKAIKEGSRYGTFFDLFGGEPLLYKQLGAAINLTSKHNLLSYITTNGFRLERRAEELAESQLKVLMISVDGWDEPSQKKRGEVPGSFDAIRRGIQALVKARGRRTFPLIRVNTAITKVNYHSIDKIAKAVYEMGVRAWVISNYYFITDSGMAAHQLFQLQTGVGEKLMQHHIPGNSPYFSADEVTELRASLSRVRDFWPTDMRIDYNWHLDLDKYYSLQQPGQGSSCRVPFTRVDIYPDGRIALCGDGQTIGNIKETSIAEAWNGARMKKFRAVQKKHPIMPMCFRCCGIVNNLQFD